jgi:hypothetical protein
MVEPHLHVRPVSEVREELSRALARFRREGAAAEPVVFGSHRKPEAVVLPFAVYAAMLAELRRHRSAALDSILSERPGEISDGITDQLLDRTLARRRRRPRA